MRAGPNLPPPRAFQREALIIVIAILPHVSDKTCGFACAQSYAPAAERRVRTRRKTRKAMPERKAAHPTFATTAGRRVRTRRPAASIPIAERRRYKGVRRESKEGVGGTRNPPIPPWPPEAATRQLTQPKAAQERRRESRKAAAERRATQPIVSAAERRVRPRRSAASIP